MSRSASLLIAPPRTTAFGSLASYMSHADPAHDQPTIITSGMMPPRERPPRRKHDRNVALSDRALHDLGPWMETAALLAPAS